MGNEKQQQKSVLTEEGFEVINDSEVYNMNAFRGGMDFYLQGGKNEAKSIFKRLRSFKDIHIPEEDIERLKALERPPLPDFETKTLAEVRAMGRFEKKKYKKKMDAFEKRRNAWDKTEAGIAWNTMLSQLMQVPVDQVYPSDAVGSKELAQEIEADEIKVTDSAKKEIAEDIKPEAPKEAVKKIITDYSQVQMSELRDLSSEELDGYISYHTETGDYGEIKEDPDEMDAMLLREESEEFRQKETLISKAEILKAQRKYPKGQMAASQYISSTAFCYAINAYCRTGENRMLGKMYATDLHNMLSTTSLSRDLVSKRAVEDVNTLAFMMGLDNAANLSLQEIKEAVQSKTANGETITLQEKGFCSTSTTSKGGYFAGSRRIPEDDIRSIGIEFIILSKKGTRGINYTCNGSRGKEDELLLDSGTKFKMIKACFNDGSEDDREVFHGHKKSWKIYLVTVPDAGEENGNAGND